MEKGDIAGRPGMRLLFMFEGLIANPAANPLIRLTGRLSAKQKVRGYEYNTVMVQQLKDVFWRLDHRFDCFTFLGEDAAEEIEKRFDADGIPVSYVLPYADVAALSSALPMMPDVEAVFHGPSIPAWTFGAKSRQIINYAAPLV